MTSRHLLNAMDEFDAHVYKNLSKAAVEGILSGLRAFLVLMDATEQFGAQVMAGVATVRIPKGKILYSIEELVRDSTAGTVNQFALKMKGSDGSRLALYVRFTESRQERGRARPVVDSLPVQDTLFPVLNDPA